MAYFSYHNKIKSLVKQGLLKQYCFNSNYPGIGFAMVLNINGKNYPIREHRFAEYFNLIGEYYLTEKVGSTYQTTFYKK